MRARVMLLVLALAGCVPAPRGSDVPMATDAPNQVVLKVPDMT
ncbi:hypothetical protein R5W24_002179 [Gemmata sp. JC717]|nr:hypothetical protein [Gemmata algarum]MDY3553088.1 hypothetical protein [Gemmata algarum]